MTMTQRFHLRFTRQLAVTALLLTGATITLSCSDGAGDITPPPASGAAGAPSGSAGRGGAGPASGGAPSSSAGGAGAAREQTPDAADPENRADASSAGGAGGGGPATGSTPEAGAAGTAPRPDAARDAGSTIDSAVTPPSPRDGAVVDQAALPPITLYLAGDSTVMTYTSGPLFGWGQELGQFFISKVTIVNRAIGGRSIQTWTEGSWASVKSSMKAGDYLMIDFGINDSGSTLGRTVTPANFKTILATMVDETVALRATAIPVTPSALQYWVNGVETNARLAPYCDAMKQVGTEKKILVADLNQASVDMLNRIGQTAAMQIYSGGDKAHFTELGATEVAKLLVAELRRINSPLASYLK